MSVYAQISVTNEARRVVKHVFIFAGLVGGTVPVFVPIDPLWGHMFRTTCFAGISFLLWKNSSEDLKVKETLLSRRPQLEKAHEKVKQEDH